VSDILKTLLQRGIQAAVVAIAGWLASAGYLHNDQQQSFIGAAFFLAAWAVDTFVIQKQKSNAAVAGGTAVAAASSDTFSATEVRAIVKDAPK
jgi:hypothetical protein